MMKTKYNQIVDIEKIATENNFSNINEIISFGKSESIKIEHNKKSLLLAIDVQNDFMEGIGSLPVVGSRNDVKNLTKWIYNNLAALSQIMCSIDTHSIKQIFHADWWKDNNNNPPPPFTIISHQDVLEGKWIPEEKEHTLAYLQHLEIENMKQLCIWPYHCLENTYGMQLETEFTKMIYFHSAVHHNSPIFVSKGQNPLTEMYGIIKAEYDPNEFVNHTVLDTIKQFEEIYIAGEASSHCVLSSIEQILNYFGNDISITSRFTILIDCMSPISGFENSTLERFHELKEKYKINIKKSTEVVL